MTAKKRIQHSLKQGTPKCTPIKGQESKPHHSAPADPAQSDQSESQPPATPTACTSTAMPAGAGKRCALSFTLHQARCCRCVMAAAGTFIPCLLQGISSGFSSTSPRAGFTPLASCWTFHTWQLGTQMRTLEIPFLPQLCHQLASFPHFQHCGDMAISLRICLWVFPWTREGRWKTDF